MHSSLARAAFVAAGSLIVAGTHQPATTPSPRVGQAMASAGAGGGVFMLGAGPASDALWQFHAGQWRRISESGPLTRSMPAAAYDTRRARLVVFGGVGHINGSRFGDTWEWDGRNWTEVQVKTPGARDHHAMAYDDARGRIVMFGGLDVDHKSFPSDTWTWDGSVWTRAETAAGPGGLGHHAMTYDSRRHRVVLFGGDRTDKPATDDVWEWDGATWERSPPISPGPGARTRHRLAYDAARGVTVLFGGQIGTGPTSITPRDTWTWDGRVWTRVDAEGPPARYVHAMAYDVRRERVVLFGGGAGVRPFAPLGDTWEWDGARWTEIK